MSSFSLRHTSIITECTKACWLTSGLRRRCGGGFPDTLPKLKTSAAFDGFNPLITSGARTRRWDFGLVNFVKCSSLLTRRAPEVINKLKPSKAADVLSFGSVLLELLSGKPPPHLLNPDVDLQDFVHSILAEEVEAELKGAAVVSMGTEVSDLDLINIKDLCDQGVEAAPKHKGKVSRSLASKTALAIRCDALGENQDNSMGVENRLKVMSKNLSEFELEARLRNLEGQELCLSDGSTKGKPKIEFYNKDQKRRQETYNAAADSVLGLIKAEADDDEEIALKAEQSEEKKDKKKQDKKKKEVLDEVKVSEDVAADEDVGKKEKKKKKKKKHVADKAAETQNEETVEAGEKKKKREHAETDEAETETETSSKKKDKKKTKE
ncbi:probable nucleolar protein 5-2 [Tanacetum coccineum]